MKWEHQQDFNKAPRTPWKVDSETHGYLKKYGNLYFLVVEQAGHMVPMELRLCSRFPPAAPLSVHFFFAHSIPSLPLSPTTKPTHAYTPHHTLFPLCFVAVPQSTQGLAPNAGLFPEGLPVTGVALQLCPPRHPSLEKIPQQHPSMPPALVYTRE